MSSTTIPAWLKASFTSSHLTTVLRTLATREIARESARSASRQRSNPSQFSMKTHSSLTTTQKSHLASDTEHYSISFGCKPWNQPYNRYLYLEPYDRMRVIVGDWDDELAEMREYTTDDGDGAGGRYINANWVRELFGGKWWIATQAPLPNTMHAFLSLLLQPITSSPAPLQFSSSTSQTRKSGIRTVVQLTQNFEQGRQKAHVYFPSTVGQSFVVLPEQGSSAPVLKVTLLASHTINEAQCVRSTVSILPISGSTPTTEGNDEEPTVFRHLLYGAWPDHGVPQREDRAGFLEFIRLVDSTNKDLSLVSEFRHSANNSDIDPDPPIMVNCSAGVGRTGTFVALASLLRAHNRLSAASPVVPPTQVMAKPSLPPSPLGPLPDAIKEDLIAQEIDSLREQRPSMVQRDEQILLIYDILAMALCNEERI